jgi:hypothetical protein
MTAAHHAAATLRSAVIASRPKIREVIVRVVPPCVPSLLPEVTNQEIDAQLRQIACAAAPKSVLTISSVTHHFLPENGSSVGGDRQSFGPGLTAEVAIVLAAGRSIKEAGDVTRLVQEALETSTIGNAQLPLVRAIVRIDASADGRELVQKLPSTPEK